MSNGLALQPTVDPPQVHERSEVGDVLHHAGPTLPGLHRHQQTRLHLRTLLFDQPTTAHHDVPSFHVDLQDLARHVLTDVLRNVARTTDVDLAGRQEHRNPDVHQQTTLDLPHHPTRHHVPFLVLRDHPLPAADPVRFALGEHDQPRLVLHRFQQNVDRRPGLHAVIPELPETYDAFRLVPNVHDDVVTQNVQHPAGQDAPDLEVFHRLLVHLRHFGLGPLTDHFRQLLLQLLLGNPQFLHLRIQFSHETPSHRLEQSRAGDCTGLSRLLASSAWTHPLTIFRRPAASTSCKPGLTYPGILSSFFTNSFTIQSGVDAPAVTPATFLPTSISGCNSSFVSS